MFDKCNGTAGSNILTDVMTKLNTLFTTCVMTKVATLFTTRVTTKVATLFTTSVITSQTARCET